MTVDELEFLVMGVWARCECRNSILLFTSWKDYFVYENKIHDWYKCVECGRSSSMRRLIHGYYPLGSVVVWDCEKV